MKEFGCIFEYNLTYDEKWTGPADVVEKFSAETMVEAITKFKEKYPDLGEPTLVEVLFNEDHAEEYG